MQQLRRRPEPSRPLSSAEIAAESEPSIALISGDGSVGTGFLVRPGILATNAHVIDGEFMTTLRVRFPSAEKDQQGPLLADLLYEDTHRDLAFLQVKSTLPPLRIAESYRFRKGEDVTVIGNPGAGNQLILENAISRGLMSTRTSLQGQRDISSRSPSIPAIRAARSSTPSARSSAWSRARAWCKNHWHSASRSRMSISRREGG